MVNNSIEIINLNKSFYMGKEEVKVLNDLSFSVEKGSFLSIMGPSGCGKSTLLYLLGGLDDPTSGQIIINGKDIGKLKEDEKAKMKRRDVGFVFQFHNLVPNLSVEDNILLPIILDGRSVKDYRIELKGILDLIELSHKRTATPRELSGGQQQRIAVARALLFQPEIILADEPIGNLDSRNGATIMELFQSINREFGKTIIQVTHSEASTLYGDSVIHLKDGVIESQKTLQPCGRGLITTL
ncbi:putative ABC transport system ATP-binding protein [Paenibacillus jilunlii]|uniref:Putative ABC transport system ATP-binding protein n=1 Tax=Paenibacillus jilunlii TaxID=682956 RepID=A0A1G9TLC8_9BACL|nr:putative ABC transport system ATP-binding protein [Paenibacillus jilunlii]